MITTPDVARQLVDKFRTNADHYASPTYNETLCRVDFINPMFEALGWDMATVKTGHEKEALQRQIDATDRQIDRLVYELHGLIEDEIRIVEEATK